MSIIYNFNGGAGDSITVYADRVELAHREKITKVSMGQKADKTIYFSDIDHVEWQRASEKHGYILFRTPVDRGILFAYMDAASHENSILFVAKPGYNQQVESMVSYVNRTISTDSSSPMHGESVAYATGELVKLTQLLDMGIISQAEFDVKKAQFFDL